MPTYGYECLSCDNQFETIQSIKDDALTTCDTCGGKLRKRIYPVGISFKGSGFYVNDYAPKSGGSSKGSSSETSKSDSSGESKSEPVKSESASSESKSESKPEAKSEPKAEAKTEVKTPAAAV